jgi:hypothetical protein
MRDAIKNLPDEMRLRFECLKLASVHDPDKETWDLVNAAKFLFRYISSGTGEYPTTAVGVGRPLVEGEERKPTPEV